VREARTRVPWLARSGARKRLIVWFGRTRHLRSGRQGKAKKGMAAEVWTHVPVPVRLLVGVRATLPRQGTCVLVSLYLRCWFTLEKSRVGYDREGSIKVCNTRTLSLMSDRAHTNRLTSSVWLHTLSDGRGIVRLLSVLAASRQAVSQLSQLVLFDVLRRSRMAGETCLLIVLGSPRVKGTSCATSSCFYWGYEMLDRRNGDVLVSPHWAAHLGVLSSRHM